MGSDSGDPACYALVVTRSNQPHQDAGGRASWVHVPWVDSDKPKKCELE